MMFWFNVSNIYMHMVWLNEEFNYRESIKNLKTKWNWVI